MAPATQFELAQPPNDAISSLVFAPQRSTRLLVSSWDKNVYLYDTHTDGADGHGTLVKSYEYRAPVMDVCFGADDNEAFTAGMDWQVLRVDLDSGAQMVISKHKAPVRRVVYSREHSLLISASWDSTLHVCNPSQPSLNPLIITLPGKPHAMAASPSKVIIAMTSRLVHIYDLSTLASSLSTQSSEPPQPWQQRESSLKFLTRAVAAMPSDAGYATSSIEGRVAVEWFDASAESQARKYAFKCHRQTSADGTDVVYPVNALAFHPTFGTFASGGGDTTVALWDAEAKRRMKVYQKFADSVAALAFSSDGRYLAVGVCPGFETGMEDYSGEGRTKIIIRELGETEAKGKGPK
ncbi:mitotic checkpoint protein BUB3 [Pseudomassariella vexata]|uniref:Mitotic checkpoint protein BUB3 n=1 Tax=Pseudomassariella vexata TaxID=1141098 RepID=A0A1Y2E0I4_9PEZI|nr:mitotic checkpoint protein BUB3 [Pseudomassariella vexata]ORY64989.1 mitotic checkpoint protein BUB3 [Pseudomassariella vexata]